MSRKKRCYPLNIFVAFFLIVKFVNRHISVHLPSAYFSRATTDKKNRHFWSLNILSAVRSCVYRFISVVVTQPAFTCSKLSTETVEQGVKYVQG